MWARLRQDKASVKMFSGVKRTSLVPYVYSDQLRLYNIGTRGRMTRQKNMWGQGLTTAGDGRNLKKLSFCSKRSSLFSSALQGQICFKISIHGVDLIKLFWHKFIIFF